MCSQLSFPAFVETALQFRSSKFALVKDILDLRRYVKPKTSRTRIRIGNQNWYKLILV